MAKKIKVLQDFRSGRIHRKGEVVEFDDKRADYFVRMGRADYVDNSVTKKKSTVTKKKADCAPCAKKEAKAAAATKELKEEVKTK